MGRNYTLVIPINVLNDEIGVLGPSFIGNQLDI